MSAGSARRILSNYNKDFYGGALLILTGLAVVYRGVAYNIGTMAEMGPGFFPAMLGVLLTLIGAAVALTAKATAPGTKTKGSRLDFRGPGCITVGITAFIALGKYGGLIPATFAVVFISALGDRTNTITRALLLSVGMVALCLVVFWWGLHIQFPLFAWGE
jgi:hypothetical protein